VEEAVKKPSLNLLFICLLVLQLLSPTASVLGAENETILPPSNLVYTEISPDDGKLSWNSVFGATSYNVYGIIDGQLILLGNSKTTNYSLNNLTEGSYSFVVSSLSGDFESGPNAPVNIEITYPDMIAPASLSHLFQNGNDIVLSWTASQYAQSYNVYQISEEGIPTLLNTTPSSKYTITNSEEGSFSYSVSAVNSLYGESALSAPVKVSVTKPIMSNPANLSFTVTNGSDITLKWNSVSFATGYKIYEIINGEEVLQSAVTTTSTKFINKSAGDYTYKVYSYSDRFGQSSNGTEVSLTVSSISMVPPSNVTSKVQNINDIVLTWGSVPYATGYNIYQVVNGEKILKSKVTATTVTYTNLPGGDYAFEIYSYSDRFGESVEGNLISLTVDTITMVPPTNITSKIQNGNDVVLSWEAAANITNYKIYQIVNGQKVLKNTVTSNTATFTNLPEGEYVYEVYSNSTRFGESQEGSVVQVTVVHPIMDPPANVIQAVNSATQFTLKWEAAPYATSYKVYQIANGQKTLKSTTSNLSVTYSNMAPGEYTYAIYSYSSRFGESKTGSEIVAILNGQVMQAPTNLTFSIKNGNDIALSWNTVSYATSYKVYKIIDGQRVLQSTMNGTSVTYSNQPEGEFTFVVHSFSSLLGESPEGSEVQVNLVHPKMEKPSNVTIKIQNGNDIALTWAAVPLATSYKIHEIVNGQEVLKKTVSTLSTTITNVPEGDHTYIIRSESTRFGGSLEGSSVTANVILPVMGAPENLTKSITNGNDLTLRWNAYPFATSYKIYQIIGGEKVWKKTVTGTSTSFTNLPEGEYTYEVYSYSDRYGESLAGSAVSHTIVFPVMQVPTNFTSSVVNGNDIQLRWNASLYATSYKIYQIIDGIKTLSKTVTGTSHTFTNMPEGDYSFEVHSFSDRFGDSPEANNLSLNVTWPVVQPPVLLGSVFNANNITLTWKTVTWANEYRVYKVNGENLDLIYKGSALSHKVYNLTEDTHSFVVTAYNNRFGESVPSNLYNETIVYPEMQAPTANLSLLSQTSARISWNFVAYANGYNVYEIINGQPVLVAEKVNNLSYTVQNLSYANHEYYVTSYSNSFGVSNPSNTVLAKLIVDTEAPVTTSNATTNWTSQSSIVNLTASDNETGVAATYYSLDGSPFVTGSTYTVVGEGIHQVKFYSVDKVGNIEGVQTINVQIDQTAPVTTTNAPASWSNKDVNLKLSGTDPLSGIANTFYSINGSDFVSGTSIVVTNEGKNKVSYYSVDLAGNKEAIKQIEVKIDKTSAVTTTNSPNDWVNGQVNIVLTANDTLSGIEESYYSINGSEFVAGTSFTISEQGIHEISYFSIDQAGNVEETKTETIKIDTTKADTTSNIEEKWYKSELMVELSAIDLHSGVDKTFYSINGSTFKQGKTFSITEQGVYEILFYSVDKAGNVEEAKMKTVKMDREAPITTSNLEDKWYSGEINVNLKATDNLSGVVKNYYSIDGLEFVEGNRFMISQEGIHEVSYYSVDEAGNVEDATIKKVLVDVTAPTVTPKFNEEYELGSNLKIAYDAKDNLSGIAYEEVLLNGKVYKNGDAVLLDQPGEYKLLVKVTDAAGLTTIVEKTFVVYIPITIEVRPNVIKGNKGIFSVHAYIPKGLDVTFDVSSITLNGVYSAAKNSGLQQVGQNGLFKFEREDFTWNPGTVELELRGKFSNGYQFVGKTIVTVKK
jgi:large repetitive protein